MIKYLLQLILITSLFFVGCKDSSSQMKSEVEKLQGTWMNEEDPLWILTFKEGEFFDQYENEKENCKFQISELSCDQEYTDLKGVFIKFYCNREFCVDVIGLTDTTFSYRETRSGKNHVFKKSTDKNFNSLH